MWLKIVCLSSPWRCQSQMWLNSAHPSFARGIQSFTKCLKIGVARRNAGRFLNWQISPLNEANEVPSSEMKSLPPKKAEKNWRSQNSRGPAHLWLLTTFGLRENVRCSRLVKLLPSNNFDEHSGRELIERVPALFLAPNGSFLVDMKSWTRERLQFLQTH